MTVSDQRLRELQAYLELVDEEAADHPTWADVRYRQAIAHVEAGDLEGAAEAFAVALETNPRYRDAPGRNSAAVCRV